MMHDFIFLCTCLSVVHLLTTLTVKTFYVEIAFRRIGKRGLNGYHLEIKRKFSDDEGGPEESDCSFQ